MRSHGGLGAVLAATITLAWLAATENPAGQESGRDRPPPPATIDPEAQRAPFGSAGVGARPLVPRERLVNGGADPVAFCFAPDTEPEVIAYYETLMQTDPTGSRYQLTGRWSGAQGTPRALTWSFVPDGLAMEGSNSELFSRLDTVYAAQGGRATWVARFQASFDRWAQLTGTSYTRITVGGEDWDDGASWGSSGSTTRGDIRIGMVLIDGAGGVLAYNYYPSNGDMTLDRGDNWGGALNENRFLRNVVMHEHGHGLGLRHVCSSDSLQLMEPFLNTSFDGPRDDDVRGAQRHYGDDFEPNDSAAAATNLGPVEVGSPISLGPPPLPNIAFASLLSLDADGENDYFRFTVAAERVLAVSLTPVGRTYDNSSQNGDGSCNSGNPVNSLAVANLNVQLLAANGVTILATAAAQPAGVAETLSNIPVTAGDYYLRVYEDGAPSQAQFYNLAVSAAFLDCDQNGVGDPCELDCGATGGVCDVPGCGVASDCNGSGTPDACEFTEADCNHNGQIDGCDILLGGSVDANANGVPDECEIPAAALVSAVSRRTCDLPLAAAPAISTEPRQGGITELRLAFDSPPGIPGPGDVTVEERQCPAPGTYSTYVGAAAMSAAVAGNELVLSFSPGLEDGRTYRVSLGGSITNVAGQSVEVRGLVGDVNSDGTVDAVDRSVLVGVWTGAGLSCATDLNADLFTDASDRSIVVGAWTGGQACAP